MASADTPKVSASIATAIGAPSACASAPPAPGAVISAISPPAASRLFAAISRSRGTSVGR